MEDVSHNALYVFTGRPVERVEQKVYIVKEQEKRYGNSFLKVFFGEFCCPGYAFKPIQRDFGTFLAPLSLILCICRNVFIV